MAGNQQVARPPFPEDFSTNDHAVPWHREYAPSDVILMATHLSPANA